MKEGNVVCGACSLFLPLPGRMSREHGGGGWKGGGHQHSLVLRRGTMSTLTLGSEVSTPTAPPPDQSSDHITDVWTHWLIGVWWKALLTHLKTQRRRYLFVSVAAFKIRTKRSAGSRRRKPPVRPLRLSQASGFWKWHVGCFFLRITTLKWFEEKETP